MWPNIQFLFANESNQAIRSRLQRKKGQDYTAATTTHDRKDSVKIASLDTI
jgi:hypothetical protein